MILNMRTTPVISPSPILQTLAQFLGILKRSCAEEGRAEVEQLERWIERFYEGRERSERRGTEAAAAASACGKEECK